MKRISEKRVNYLKDLTNICYRLSEVLTLAKLSKDSNSAKIKLYDYKDMAEIARYSFNKNAPELKWAADIQKEVSERYLHVINTLKDEDLQDIIDCHNAGKFMRADKTLNSIISEISRRSLGDSEASDLVYLFKDRTSREPTRR